MPCSARKVSIGGVVMSSSDFDNAQPLISIVGSDSADPTADEYESYIANGHNTASTKGIHEVLPTQTKPPLPITAPPVAVATTAITNKSGSAVNCKTWDGSNYDIQLSEHFLLRSMTIGAVFKSELTSAFGFDKQTRFCNMTHLAINVLEPLYEKFGQYRINSGLRNSNSVSNGVSQHCKGQAADIQFPSWTYEMYWDRAKWIAENIPFDQFIFEHSDKSRTVWLHLSYNKDGGRAKTDPRKIMTMYRGKYDSGLKKYY